MIRTRDDPILELSRSHHRKSHKDHHFRIQQHEQNVYVNDPTDQNKDLEPLSKIHQSHKSSEETHQREEKKRLFQ